MPGQQWRHSRPAHCLDEFNGVRYRAAPSCGAIAQLGERLHGMQEVGGSIPPGSTSLMSIAILSKSIRPHRLEA
jgi:hypothetical protein